MDAIAQKNPSRVGRLAKAIMVALAVVFVAAACDPGPENPHGRAHAAIHSHVPTKLRESINYRIEVIGGVTSYAYPGGLIQVSKHQMTGSWDHARSIALHEFGHQVAWKHGTGAFNGAAPKGFPYKGARAEEVWADCFATALTGVAWPTYGKHPTCPQASVNWTRNWIDRWR